MITEKKASALLKKYKLSDSRIAHSTGVADRAFELASAIIKRNPALPVDPYKVKIAGLLHDIGRSRDGDHEINSVSILRSEGLDSIADIVMHGTIYEIRKLQGMDDPTLLPACLECKIVAYADATFRLEPVSLQERFDEILTRRKTETEKIKSVHLAMPRFFALEKELLTLI